MAENVKVKICGIKSYIEAKVCTEAGADFLGFNFVSASRRFIQPEKVKEIVDALPRSVAKVGVFMNADLMVINQLTNYLKLDLVQLHGLEPPEYLNSVKRIGIIKTFSLPADFNIAKTMEEMTKYHADYFLLDREVQGRGELLNPDKVRKLTSLFPVILAGGLTVGNVVEIVKSARPQAIDVAGGVETNGRKDPGKIIKFIQEVKKI